MSSAPTAARRAGFVGWSGACTDVGLSRSLTTDADLTVSARFGPLTVPLAIRIVGSGSVTAPAQAVSCSRDCYDSVAADEPLVLRATPRRGWSFARWEGACRGTAGTCRITPSASISVRAVFRRDAA